MSPQPECDGKSVFCVLLNGRPANIERGGSTGCELRLLDGGRFPGLGVIEQAQL